MRTAGPAGSRGVPETSPAGAPRPSGMTGPTVLTVLEETRAFADAIDQSPCDGCDSCGARCTTGVPMLLPEFEAIRGFLGGPDGGEALAVERQEKRVAYPGAEDTFYVACRFRDVERGRCSVYPVRPLVCRLFGHVEWLPCPIEKVAGPVPGGLETMRRYGEAPQKTYEEWLDPSSPLPAASSRSSC